MNDPHKMTRERVEAIRRQLKEWRNDPPVRRPLRAAESDTLKLKEAIGSRLLLVIESSDNPLDAMDELALAAENRGLIPFASDPRRDNPVNFVKDLWWDNPATQERVNLNVDQLHPLQIKDLPSALDAIM